MKTIKILAYAFNLTLISCASTNMTIQSEPTGADIIVIHSSGREDKLGQTPITITPEIRERFPTDNWHLSISKAGFAKDQVFIETKMFKTIGQISLKLTPDSDWAQAYQDKNAYKYLNDVSSMTAEIQAATVKGDYPKAEGLAKSLVTRYPKLSAGWNLLGNIYYLQKRLEPAMESYQKSLDLNPADQITKSILEKLRGGRL